jgi:dihydrofolate reductase
MAKLIYSAFTSLDGYVVDETGNFDWAELNDDGHAYINNRERQIGTYLFGRKIYETVAVWESPDVLPNLTPTTLEFTPIWQAAEKIVYSTTLPQVTTARTRLERRFDADVVRELKVRATRDLEVGGPTLEGKPFEPVLSTNITCSSRRSSRAVAIPICPARSP